MFLRGILVLLEDVGPAGFAGVVVVLGLRLVLVGVSVYHRVVSALHFMDYVLLLVRRVAGELDGRVAVCQILRLLK